MLNRFGYWYVVASICLALALPIYALLHLNSLRNANSERAAHHFRATIETLRVVADTSRQPSSPNFWRNALAPILDQPSNLIAVAISDAQGRVEYLWTRAGNLPDISQQRAIQPGEIGANFLRYNRLYELFMSDTLRADNQSFVAESTYRVIDRRAIIILLRNGLLIVLAFVLITLVVLLTQLKRTPKQLQITADIPPTNIPPTDSKDRPHTTDEGDNDTGSAPHPPSNMLARRGLWPVRAAALKQIGRSIARARRKELSLALVSYRDTSSPGNASGATNGAEHSARLARHLGFDDYRLAWSAGEWLIIMPGVALQQSWPLIRDALAHIAADAPQKDCAPTIGISSCSGRRLKPDRLIRECEAALKLARDKVVSLALFAPSKR